MKYFRNTELTKFYSVSEKAVRNWIDAAQHHKNDLDLCYDQGKAYVADTFDNKIILDRLASTGRKYRNRRSHKDLTPKDSFYEIYTYSQILDIVRELEIHRELPGKYKYFGEGAAYWNQYLYQLYNAGSNNILTNTIEAIKSSLSYLDPIIKSYTNINIINICIGNSLAAKNILEHTYKTRRLHRLINIDLSSAMLGISKHHIEEWFQGKVNPESYVRDLDYERFNDIIRRDSFGTDASNTINIILFLAGPIVNFREPRRTISLIRDSMGANDLLITTLKRDTEMTRNFFEFNLKSDPGVLSKYDGVLLELLNIEESFYELHQSFDEKERLRTICIKLKADISIKFDVGSYHKSVELKKGEVITVWRSLHHSDQDLFNLFIDTGFAIQQVTKSLDDQLLLLTTKLNT